MEQTRICAQSLTDAELKRQSQLLNMNLDQSELTRLKAISMKGKTWPQKAQITIGFYNPPKNGVPVTPYEGDKDRNGNTIIRDPMDMQWREQAKKTPAKLPEVIATIVKERIQPYINLKLVFVQDVAKALIRVSFDTKTGAWSYVGRDNLNISKGRATMNFGWFDTATVIHEFGHMLGLAHEHQSPYGNVIDWNYTKLYDWAKRTQGWNKQQVDQQIVERYSSSEVNGTTFDPKSIMLYFYDKSLTNNNSGTEMNRRLSKTDVTYLNSLYREGAAETPDQFYRRVYKEGIDPAVVVPPVFKQNDAVIVTNVSGGETIGVVGVVSTNNGETTAEVYYPCATSADLAKELGVRVGRLRKYIEDEPIAGSSTGQEEGIKTDFMIWIYLVSIALFVILCWYIYKQIQQRSSTSSLAPLLSTRSSSTSL